MLPLYVRSAKDVVAPLSFVHRISLVSLFPSLNLSSLHKATGALEVFTEFYSVQ